MVARDIGEEHRVSSPLDLVFNLTFVVAVVQSAGVLVLAAGVPSAFLAQDFFGIILVQFGWIASLLLPGEVVPWSFSWGYLHSLLFAATVVIIALVPYTITATSIVDDVRRSARGASR